MKWRDEIVLVRHSEGVDEDGFLSTVIETKRAVYANKISIGTSEFYLSQTAGIEVTHKFEVRAEEYDGETIVEYHGAAYEVVRTYEKETITELTLRCLKGKTDGEN